MTSQNGRKESQPPSWVMFCNCKEMVERMTSSQIFTNSKILLIIVTIVVATIATVSYIYIPSILAWVNPDNSVSIEGVSYPQDAYRGQNLPITVYLSNIGDTKDVLVEIASKDNPTLRSTLKIDASQSKDKITILLPVRSLGDQSFRVQVTWIGPGGFCKIQQNSTDKPFRALAADYKTSSPTVIASRAQGFDWSLTVTNIGNTPADLAIQLFNKDPLILSDNSGGTQQLSNIQVGETRTIGFHFDVPSDAILGDHTMTLSFTTSYPEIAYYKDCKETTYQDYTVTIQESPIKTQIDNAGYLIAAVLALGGGGTVFTLIMGKRRR